VTAIRLVVDLTEELLVICNLARLIILDTTVVFVVAEYPATINNGVSVCFSSYRLSSEVNCW
jgi:hypothetical protein